MTDYQPYQDFMKPEDILASEDVEGEPIKELTQEFKNKFNKRLAYKTTTRGKVGESLRRT